MELDTPDQAPEGWTVLAISGEVDVVAAPELRDRLTELIGDGTPQVIVDLDDVDFIDSTGLGVLVGAVRRARAASGDVRLATSSARLTRLLDATGLDDVFVVAASADEAAAADAVSDGPPGDAGP